MNNKLEKLAIFISKYIFYFFVLLFSVSNILFTATMDNGHPGIYRYKFGISIINIILIGIIFFFLFYANKKDYFKISENKYLMTLLIIVSLLGIYWIFSNSRQFYAFDDSRNCFEAAQTILSGDYTPLGYKSYLNTYPHNLPLVTYFMLIIKVFGSNNAVTVINIVNLVFVVIGYLYLYKITNRLFNNRKTNMNLITLMFLSMQFVFFSYYVYGNVMSISLSFVSIYYLLEFLNNYKTKNLIISCISICLGVAIKNNVMIVLVAEIIYLLIETIIKKKIKCLLLAGLMVISTIICTTGVIKFWEQKANYNYDNKLPKICWIAYGFNYDERHPGSYFDALERYHSDNGYNVDFTKSKAIDFIKGTIEEFSKRPLLIPKFYAQKMLIAWTNPEYGVFSYDHLKLDNNMSNINKSIVKGSINYSINNVWDSCLSIVSIGLFVYMIKKRKEIELLELILAVVVIGGFLFHMFWELQSIYMYHYYLCLLPYAAHGLMLLFNKK